MWSSPPLLTIKIYVRHDTHNSNIYNRDIESECSFVSCIFKSLRAITITKKRRRGYICDRAYIRKTNDGKNTNSSEKNKLNTFSDKYRVAMQLLKKKKILIHREKNERNG